MFYCLLCDRVQLQCDQVNRRSDQTGREKSISNLRTILVSTPKAPSFHHIDHLLVDGPDLLLIHLDLLPVVGHKTVHLAFHIGGLGVNSC